MKKEDKELLLKDLSARICYGVKVSIPRIFISCEILEGIHKGRGVSESGDWSNIEQIKPYLRSISNMTEKEKCEFKVVSHLLVHIYKYNNQIRNIIIDNDISEFNTFDSESCFRKVDLPNVVNGLEWLNAHHFDYRGLIERGLALEASEGLYKIKD